MTMTISGSTGLTFPDDSVQALGSYTGFKNRIINGAMQIDQRNAGASVTTTVQGQYTLDRWNGYITQASKYSVQQNAGSVTAPVGFTNYLGITSLSAYSVTSTDGFAIQQRIEGLNVADLGWGTANATPVTLSFWVRSSLTGTFGGAVYNSAANRFYPFSYTISTANTWEQKTVTIVGDTTGTWLTTNGVGITLSFGLGAGSTLSQTAGAWTASAAITSTGATSVVGTNGATFFITGVQLEKGSTATSFDYRPYGTELALCQRYYQRYQSSAQSYPLGPVGYVYGLTQMAVGHTLPVLLRATPTITFNNLTTRGGKINGVNDTYSITSISDVAWLNTNQITYTAVASGASLALGSMASIANTSPADNTSFIAYSSEL
jgi:hypothetical protein